jgi:uncharacterized protein
LTAAGHWIALLAALPIGFLIGIVGIGGVLLVPVLAEFGGYSQHDAVGLSLASFICLGIAGMWMRLRGAAIEKNEWLLYCAMIPGAVAGAVALAYVPELLLRFIVALTVTATGLWTIFGRTAATPREPAASAPGLALTGAFTGGASALTGTGGPLVLMPLLLARGVGAQEALGLAKAAQLPIALSATITRGMAGGIDLPFAAALSLVLIIGMVAGSLAALRARGNELRTIIGWAMICIGAGLCIVDAARTLH